MKAARVLVPLFLVGLCVALAGGQGVLDRVSGLSFGWLAAAVLALNAVILLSAARWRLTAAALGLLLSPGDAVREYYVAQFVNQTIPGGVLGDAARALRSRNGGAVKPAAQAVVLERASGQVGMAAVLGLGIAAAAMGPASILSGGASGLIWAPAAVLSLGVICLGGLAAVRGAAGSWRAAVRAAILRHLPAQAALSVLIAALTVTGFVAAARATGTVLAPAAAALLVPLILTAMLLPASVAGWGWREGAAAALFPLAGADAAAGLAASIAFGLAALASALPGAFFVLRSRSDAGPWTQLRDATRRIGIRTGR